MGACGSPAGMSNLFSPIPLICRPGSEPAGFGRPLVNRTLVFLVFVCAFLAPRLIGVVGLAGTVF